MQISNLIINLQPEYFLKLTKLNIERKKKQKTSKQLDKRAKDLGCFTKENIRWQKSIRKDATSLVIRKRQIKTTMRYHCIPIRMAKTRTGVGRVGVAEEKKEKKKVTILSTDEFAEQLEFSHTDGGMMSTSVYKNKL